MRPRVTPAQARDAQRQADRIIARREEQSGRKFSDEEKEEVLGRLRLAEAVIAAVRERSS